MSEDPEPTIELTAAEHALADQLEHDRPLPAAGFRGGLGRRLEALDPGYGPRPERLRLIVCGYLSGAAVLLALATLQVTGAL
jgi:hypothetical protein